VISSAIRSWRIRKSGLHEAKQFPSLVTPVNIMDYTFVQSMLDDQSVLGRNIFFHPQYASLGAWSTVANSDYHAGTLSISQRYREGLSWGFNYTLAKSIDNASGLQTNWYSGGAFVLNSLRPKDNRLIRILISGISLVDTVCGSFPSGTERGS
jgi:hypothetical protein